MEVVRGRHLVEVVHCPCFGLFVVVVVKTEELLLF
jgi:hypothetical protein